MKLEGNKIILDAGESVIIEATEKKGEQHEQQTPSEGRISLQGLLDSFNRILVHRGYKSVTEGMSVRDYLAWAYGLAQRYYDSDEWMFRPENCRLVYDYRGANNPGDSTAYNGMQAWLMASCLAELVPDSGHVTNTQTELYNLAYEIGGGKSYPLYNGNTFKSDPYAMREAASVMYAICRGDGDISVQIDKYRSELGGHPIPASAWDDLGYQNTTLSDGQGRYGYRMDYLGYCVNTEWFLPNAPEPRVPGTTVCELPNPWEQGQPKSLFNPLTGNYLMDEKINDFVVGNYNMMSQTPISVWNSYSLEKRNRMINVAAIPPCTFTYMFGKKNVRFDGIKHRAYGNNPAYDYYCFSETNEDTGLVLDGPFSDLQGMYRYTKGDREKCLETVATILDNFRFPTQDPNYGRCRPGCKVSRSVEPLNPTPGAADNEVYNVDLCVMVADDAAGKEKAEIQDGFAADSPRSYVSGHSAQIWGLALMLTQMDNDGNCETWISKAFDYSVNRSIGRFHWNSDCIYGRLFGAMALPVINAMSGLQGGLTAVRDYVVKPTPTPQGAWVVNIIVKNETGAPIQSTGEIRLYVDNHIGVNTYLPNARVGTIHTFEVGETNFSMYNVHAVLNGDDIPPADYEGSAINDVRFYDYRHWNNTDAGFSAVLDTTDKRCDKTISQSDRTYVIKITK